MDYTGVMLLTTLHVTTKSSMLQIYNICSKMGDMNLQHLCTDGVSQMKR